MAFVAGRLLRAALVVALLGILVPPCPSPWAGVVMASDGGMPGSLGGEAPSVVTYPPQQGLATLPPQPLEANSSHHKMTLAIVMNSKQAQTPWEHGEGQGEMSTGGRRGRGGADPLLLPVRLTHNCDIYFLLFAATCVTWYWLPAGIHQVPLHLVDMFRQHGRHHVYLVDLGYEADTPVCEPLAVLCPLYCSFKHPSCCCRCCVCFCGSTRRTCTTTTSHRTERAHLTPTR